MGRELKRLKRRRELIQRMDEILDRASTTLVVHYSCESFDNRPEGRTPRVTSIAVRNYASGQTDSFSIHQIAEEQAVAVDQITAQYDQLECLALNRFFTFVMARQHYSWVHWNMRDVNYGFAAIEHRYRVLGGTPILIPEDRKFDLARALIDIYGVGYIGHPRLEKLIALNHITALNMLTGLEEAAAFENREYFRLHQSTLRKVDSLANIFERASTRSLKTNSSWAERNGFSPSVLAELLKEHWIVTTLIVVGGLLTFAIRVLDLWNRTFGKQ